MSDTKNIYKKIGLVMKDVNPIGKDRTNNMQKYKFRGIDDVYNGLHKHFAKHGVFITSNVVNQIREERQTKNGGLLLYTILTVEFIFFCEDGSSVSCTTVGEAMDSGDKSCNKAMSAALKYALMQMLLIPTQEEKDTEDQTPQPSAAKAKKVTKTPPVKKKLSDANFVKIIKRVEAGETDLIKKTEDAFVLSDDQQHEWNNLKASSSIKN